MPAIVILHTGNGIGQRVKYYIYNIYSYKKHTIQSVQNNMRCSTRGKSNVKVVLHHYTILWDVHRNRHHRGDEIWLQTSPVKTRAVIPMTALFRVRYSVTPICLSVGTEVYHAQHIAQSWNICPQVKCRLIQPLHPWHPGFPRPVHRPPIGPRAHRCPDHIHMFFKQCDMLATLDSGLVTPQGACYKVMFETQLIRYSHSGQSKMHIWISAHAWHVDPWRMRWSESVVAALC